MIHTQHTYIDVNYLEKTEGGKDRTEREMGFAREA